MWLKPNQIATYIDRLLKQTAIKRSKIVNVRYNCRSLQ